MAINKIKNKKKLPKGENPVVNGQDPEFAVLLPIAQLQLRGTAPRVRQFDTTDQRLYLVIIFKKYVLAQS
jgi:hypothetical protein